MLADLPPQPPAPAAYVAPAAPLRLSTTLRRSNMLPGEHRLPTAGCVAQAAERNHIDPLVLLAVLKVEGGKPGELALNRNGTFDLGPMSINTVWVPELARHFGVEESRLHQRLASDGCTNVAAAAWILGRKIAQTGSLWEGVAHYHSSNPVHQGRYLDRVYRQFARIVARFAAGLR